METPTTEESALVFELLTGDPKVVDRDRPQTARRDVQQTHFGPLIRKRRDHLMVLACSIQRPMKQSGSRDASRSNQAR